MKFERFMQMIRVATTALVGQICVSLPWIESDPRALNAAVFFGFIVLAWLVLAIEAAIQSGIRTVTVLGTVALIWGAFGMMAFMSLLPWAFLISFAIALLLSLPGTLVFPETFMETLWAKREKGEELQS